MSHVCRGIYRVLVSLHPPAFRREFGREMLLDFDDAQETHSNALLLGDALLSMGKQWVKWGVYGNAAEDQNGRRALLAGRYATVIQSGPSFFELTRGAVVAVLLAAMVGFALNSSNSHAAVQNRAGKRMPGSHATKGGRTPDEVTPVQRASAEAPVHHAARSANVSFQGQQQVIVLGGSSNGESGYFALMGATLGVSLSEVVAVSAFIWIAAFVLYKSPRLARWLALAGLGLLAIAEPMAFGAAVNAQMLHAAGPLPSFEVVTIRPWQPQPSASVAAGMTAPRKIAKVSPIGVSGQATDRVRMIGQVQILIESAYNIPLSQGDRIVGAPEWVGSEAHRYDVQAKIDDVTFAKMRSMTAVEQQEQVHLMEQSLLQDRFKLKAHFEMREMAVFVLSVGKSGPSMTASGADETRSLLATENEHGSVLTAKAVTMEELVHSPLLSAGGRMIVNQTGLQGAYDFTLRWKVERAGMGNAEPESADDAPSLFTAVQEQLGLRLVAAKAPVEVLVIDHIEAPSEN